MSDTFNPDVIAAEPSDASPEESTREQPSEGPERAPEAQNSDKAGSNGEAKKANGSKHPGAYERAKQRVAAQKAALAQQETQLRAREAALAQREQAMKPQVKKRDYTLADLRKYHKQWADVGHRNYDPDLAEKAEAEIAAMEAEQAQSGNGQMPAAGSPEHTAQWHQAEQELAQADPEFMRNGTRLDGKLREIMSGPDGEIYRQHPRGIVAAYHKAKMDLLQSDNGELTAKIQELEKELKRYHGLTGVGSGVSRRPGVDGIKVDSPADFAKLSTAQMKKYLLSNAGRGGGAPLF